MRLLTALSLLLVAACGGAASQSDAGVDAGPSVRETRYCEVLVAQLDGGAVHVQVFSTQGLNDCPQSQWAQVDASALKAELGATQVTLNGPRNWAIDSFGSSMLLDTTVRTFGSLQMRQAGAIDLTLVEALSLGGTYTVRSITRDSEFIFFAGRPVYELVDASMRVFTMQSYSQEKVSLTAQDLATLGTRLTLPAGWSFRVRTLDTTLRVKAANQHQNVLQDDLLNTYLQSQ
jgi:hypothetical protein